MGRRISPRLYYFGIYNNLRNGLFARVFTVKLPWHFSLLVIAWAAIAAVAHAGNEHPERWYQVRWCEAHHGQIEYVLPDRTRLGVFWFS